jgi:general secretion pathway protein G
MKLRCPYCQVVFEPQTGSRCPSCGKAMAMPAKVRLKDETKHPKRNRLSPELRQKQRELEKEGQSGAETWTRITKSPRYVAVLVILFVIVGAVLSQQATRHHAEKVRRSNPIQHAQSDLATLRTALEMFHKDCGRYPSTRESLEALIRSPRVRGWDGPYIRTLFPDPWKNSYRYSMTKGVMHLTSDGPDEKPDTLDDLSAPAPDMNLIYPTNPVVTPGRLDSLVP